MAGRELKEGLWFAGWLQMGRVAVREANWKLNCGQIETLGTSDVSLRRAMTCMAPVADVRRNPGVTCLWTGGERRTALRTVSLLPPMKLELTSSRDKADKAVLSVTGSRGSAPFACQTLVGIDSMDVFKKSILPATKWC